MTDDLKQAKRGDEHGWKYVEIEVPRKRRFRHSLLGRDYLEEELLEYYDGIMHHGKD